MRLWHHLAAWAVPEPLFPRHLTLGDWPLLVLAYPRVLSDDECAQLVARWREKHGRS